MKIGAAVFANGSLSMALTRVIEAASAPLAGAAADLGFLFASNHFEDDLEQAARTVRERTGVRALIGCTAESIIGTEGEIEQEPAVSLWLGSLPGVELGAFHVAPGDVEGLDSADAIRRLVGCPAEAQPTLVVLGDPFSFQVVDFLNSLNDHFAQPLIGGMASGAEGAGQSVLICDDEAHREGAVGVWLSGAIKVDVIVSQGCRPVGRPFVITKAEQNIIRQLGGKAPLAMLHEVFEAATEDERKLMQNGIFVGQVINEYKESFERGDFLIRNMLGADRSSGALAIGDYARVGRTIQFHVRDGKTADEDLKSLLAPHHDSPPAGALLFTCNGRGKRMFPAPNHDLECIQSALGKIPVAGFFCAGELGPIGGKNFIHGHTASIALLRGL